MGKIHTYPVQTPSNDTLFLGTDPNKANATEQYRFSQLADNIFAKRIIVRTKEDLMGELDATAQYFIDGVIDMEGESIQVPTDLQLYGMGFGVSKIISSQDNYTMFVNGSAGNLFISFLDIEVTGANSKVFDVDNAAAGGFGAIEMNTVNFNNCTSLGTIKNYRQLLMTGCGLFGCADGVTFDGAWLGGARIDTTIIRSMSGGTVFKCTPTMTFGSRLVSDVNIEVPSGVVGFEAIEANFPVDGTFELLGAIFSGAGTYITGVSGSSVKANFRDNKGILNTLIGGESNNNSDTLTTISGVSTYTDLLMTTSSRNLAHFSESAGVFTYLSSTPIRIAVQAVMSLAGSNNNVARVKLRHWDDSSGSYVDVTTAAATLNGGGSADRAENMPIQATVEMEVNDRLEWQIQNETNSNNITLLSDSNIILSEV